MPRGDKIVRSVRAAVNVQARPQQNRIGSAGVPPAVLGVSPGIVVSFANAFLPPGETPAGARESRALTNPPGARIARTPLAQDVSRDDGRVGFVRPLARGSTRP